jgi:endonuclease-8
MEGPPLKVIAEKLLPFQGQTILSVSGNTKIEKEILVGGKVLDIKTRGKLLFFVCSGVTLKVHFLMFGSYRINQEREGMTPRLSLNFGEEKVNLYNCSVRFIASKDIDDHYPADVDILSSAWNGNKVLKLASLNKSEYICDLLLDQSIFAGVGNIIKNEALFLAKIHPLSIVGSIPLKRMKTLNLKTREFSLLFYEKSRKNESLRAEFRVYNRKACPVCKGRIRRKKMGRRQRVSYVCPTCQKIFP